MIDRFDPSSWNWNKFHSGSIHNIEVYCLLVRLKEPKRLTLSLLEREELRLDIMQVQKILPVAEWVKTGVLILEPPRLSVKNDGQFLMYQTIGISFVHNSKYPTNLRLPVLKYYDRWVGNKTCEDYSTRHKRIIGRINKNHYDLLVPENLLSSRRRRELRILICFNSKNRNPVENGGGPFYEVMKYKFFLWLMKYKFFLWLWPNYRFLDKGKHRDKNEEMKYKFFLWPNYRLEDLACMNRYWFDTNNGSRFSMLRLHMYPRLKIR